MKNKVTNRQIFFIMVLLLCSISTLDLPKSMAQADGRTAWISLIFIALVFALFASMIAKMNQNHQGQVFFDYGKEITNNFVIYTVVISYIAYFFILLVFLDTKMANFLKSNFLPNTPCAILILSGILLYSYIASKDLTSIARLAEIIGIAFLITTIGICIAMLTTGTPYNILPLFNIREISVKSIKEALFPFGGIEFLLVVPFYKENKKIAKKVFLTLIFIGIFYILIVEGTIMTLGINNAMVLNDSFIEALRVVEIPMIERLDIYYLTFNLSALFLQMILLYTMLVEFLCKLIPKIKRWILSFSAGAISFILCFINSKIESSEQFFLHVIPILIIIFSLLLPSIFFIADIINRKFQK